MPVATASSPRWTTRLASAALAPAHWVERARGRKRIALLMLYAAIISACAFMTWWSQSLRGLPDIGDPFDVEAFRAKLVSDAENAFLMYEQASAKQTLLTNGPHRQTYLLLAGTKPWSSAPAEVSQYLESNREALLLWKQGTERPGIQVRKQAGATRSEPYRVVQDALHTFPHLAMLEAMRLEELEDMAAAWSWYRAVLKAHRHVTVLNQFHWGRGLPRDLPTRMRQWSADPRVDAGMLRTALDEALAIDATTAPYSTTLKFEYLRIMKDLDEVRRPRDYETPNEDEWYKYFPMYAEAVSFVKREPERSRRVFKLIYANLLLHADDPWMERPRMIRPAGIFDVTADPAGIDSSRRMAPEALAKRLDSTLYAKHMVVGENYLFLINQEQSARASMLLDLARALYEREHGKPPKSDRDLIGKYLDHLPDGAIDPGPP